MRVADCVDQVRSSFQQITVLRLADHPAVQALMTSHAHAPKHRFDTVVVDCVYHLTPEQQLRDVSAAAKAINKQNLQAINLKEKLKTEEARHGIPVAGPITRDIVVASSMYDHLLHVLRQGGPGFRFSLGVPADTHAEGGVHLVGLSELLSSSLGQPLPRIPFVSGSGGRPRLAPDIGDSDLDGAMDDGPVVPGLRMAHFTVVHASGGRSKVPFLCPGAGRRLTMKDIVVTAHAVKSTGPVMVSEQPMTVWGHSGQHTRSIDQRDAGDS